MENKVEVGDVIFVAGHGFLAKSIQWFMKIYRKKRGLPEAKVYNHVATVVNLWGEKYIAESAAKGVQIIPWADDYVRRQDCLVKDWVDPFDEIEKREWSELAIKYALKPHKYDKLNFWYNMKSILLGKWTGPTGEKAEKKVYCSEYVAILMDKVSGCFDGKTYDKTPLDVELSKELKVKFYSPKTEKE